jgi:hypothetical protein
MTHCPSSAKIAVLPSLRPAREQGTFSEGFDLPDLKEAKVLLSEFAS